LGLAGLAGVVPVHIGGTFLPHLDGFCHLFQDNLNQYLLALILGDRLYKSKKNTFPTVKLYSNYFLRGQLGFATMYRRFLSTIYIPIMKA